MMNLEMKLARKNDEDEFCRYVIQRDINGIALHLDDVKSWHELPNGESYVYTDQQDSILQLTYTSSAEGTSLFLDTVKYKQTETLVNGMPGTIYIALSNDETNAIVWTDENQETLFYISGPLNEEDLIKMAESIEPKK